MSLYFMSRLADQRLTRASQMCSVPGELSGGGARPGWRRCSLRADVTQPRWERGALPVAGLIP